MDLFQAFPRLRKQSSLGEKKIARVEERYFGNARSAAEFKKYKTYRLMLFKKTE